MLLRLLLLTGANVRLPETVVRIRQIWIALNGPLVLRNRFRKLAVSGVQINELKPGLRKFGIECNRGFQQRLYFGDVQS
jgi:hypothetical protein